jgi:hypothetical protein
MHAGWIVRARGGVGVLGQRCEPLLGCARVGRRCGWSAAGDAISLVRMRAARDAGKPACSVTCLQQRFSSEAVPLLEDFFGGKIITTSF